MHPVHKASSALVLGLLATALAGCASSSKAQSDGAAGGGRATSPLAQFSDQGVSVTIGVKDRSSTRATLVATFTPDRPGFHLYSVDMPATGINGVGRPISMVAQGALTSSGPLTAETRATTLTLAGTGLTLPVYPDGPVTVDLPVTIAGRSEATLLVGYAACSKTTCLPPVSGHRVQLVLR